eukprot:COSAG05_NODE_885_length_6763_cov_10.115396_4_plen_167_part_00
MPSERARRYTRTKTPCPSYQPARRALRRADAHPQTLRRRKCAHQLLSFCMKISVVHGLFPRQAYCLHRGVPSEIDIISVDQYASRNGSASAQEREADSVVAWYFPPAKSNTLVSAAKNKTKIKSKSSTDRFGLYFTYTSISARVAWLKATLIGRSTAGIASSYTPR